MKVEIAFKIGFMLQVILLLFLELKQETFQVMHP